MEKYKFTLYIVEDTKVVKTMIERIRIIFDNVLKKEYEFEVVDILKNPDLAIKNKIIASPTLVKELPPPPQKFIGEIKDETSLLFGFEIRKN